jgi:hypothetical protein
MKKSIVVLGALLVVPSLKPYKTTIKNNTDRLLEVGLHYPRTCRKKHAFQIKPGKTKTQKHGICCLRSITYVARSGPKSGIVYRGYPQPTRLLPWKSCKNNDFIINEIPEDNSLLMEDKADKGQKGYYLYMENKGSKKIKVHINYATADCSAEEKTIDAGKTMFINTGSVRAGVYLGKIKPKARRCCIKNISVSPLEGKQHNKWFTFNPSRKKSMYGGHCGSLKLYVKENPDESLFVAEEGEEE